MAEDQTKRKSARIKRIVPKKFREDIYEYDTPENEDWRELNSNQQELKYDEDPHADDDSFSYNGPKPKRNTEVKRGRGRERQTKLNF